MKMYLSKVIHEQFNPLPGIYILLDFILKYKEGKEINIGSNILIIGGGHASIEAARICKEKGANKVYILIRSSKEKSLFTEEEVESVKKEGINIYFQTVLTKMMGRDNKLEGVEICEITSDGEEKGQRRILEVDTIFVGAGRFPELIYVLKGSEEREEIKWETVSPYAGPNTDQEIGIFRPGEAISDYKAAVEAIGAGRRMAASIHHYIKGFPVEAPRNMIRKNTYVLNIDELHEVKPIPRQKILQRSLNELIEDPSAEITIGYTESQAREEANRCLQCGLICYSKERLH